VAGGFASLALPGEEARSFRAEVERRIADRGVGDRVHLTGWVDGAEVSELLSAADAVALPFTAGVTTKSGSLLAALEHGAPVLATVADDRDPALVDGVTVLDVGARRDPRAIAESVLRLLEEPELAATVARGGQELAARRGWPAIAAMHRAVYASVLDA
jgi:glycosyltransferase involved in cell wall biosynthesis